MCQVYPLNVKTVSLGVRIEVLAEKAQVGKVEVSIHHTTGFLKHLFSHQYGLNCFLKNSYTEDLFPTTTELRPYLEIG